MEESKNSSRTRISFRNYHITIDTYITTLKNSHTSLSLQWQRYRIEVQRNWTRIGFFCALFVSRRGYFGLITLSSALNNYPFYINILDSEKQAALKVTVYLQGCLASERCSASGLNCRYLSLVYQIKAYRVGYQTISSRILKLNKLSNFSRPLNASVRITFLKLQVKPNFAFRYFILFLRFPDPKR